jgi:hypothetical protein
MIHPDYQMHRDWKLGTGTGRNWECEVHGGVMQEGFINVKKESILVANN